MISEIVKNGACPPFSFLGKERESGQEDCQEPASCQQKGGNDGKFGGDIPFLIFSLIFH
ncbi:hypothetical protein ES703_19050 [subsurface metagenome]